MVNSTIDGTQQTSWQSPQAVASDANGNYVVVWSSNQNGNGWDIYARRFNAVGQRPGRRVPGQFGASDRRPDVRHRCHERRRQLRRHVDRSQRHGRLRRYLRQGSTTPTAPRRAANSWSTRPPPATRCTAPWRWAPTAASWSPGRAKGRTATAGASTASGLTRRAISVGPQEFQVNTTTSGDQMFARVAMDGSGNFTVVWQGHGRGRQFGTSMDDSSTLRATRWDRNSRSTRPPPATSITPTSE